MRKILRFFVTAINYKNNNHMKFNIRLNYSHQEDKKESKKNKYFGFKMDER